MKLRRSCRESGEWNEGAEEGICMNEIPTIKGLLKNPVNASSGTLSRRLSSQEIRLGGLTAQIEEYLTFSTTPKWCATQLKVIFDDKLTATSKMNYLK